MKWKNLQMPKGLVADAGNSDRYGRFTLDPLERGFGTTLGNALRRVLLSSLQGAAITSVRIEGVLHEFSTLPGVIEDVTEIILNLKQVRLKLHGDGPKKGTFEIKGKGEVRAGNMVVDPEIEILNPDLHIATLNRDGDLRMEVEINGGRGYVSADQHSASERPSHQRIARPMAFPSAPMHTSECIMPSMPMASAGPRSFRIAPTARTQSSGSCSARFPSA